MAKWKEEVEEMMKIERKKKNGELKQKKFLK
jgi:hypothetical protein